MKLTSRGLMALALSPIVVLLASGTRLIIIGNYDTTTATTMASSGSLGQTILGTVVPLLPTFLPASLVFLVIFRQWGLLIFAAAAAALLSPAYISIGQGWHRAYPQFRSAVDHAWHGQWHDLWQDSHLLVWCAALGAGIALWDYYLSMGPSNTASSNAPSALIAAAYVLSPPIGAIFVGAICTLALLFIQQVYHVSTTLNLDTISETLRRPWLPAEKIDLKSGGMHIGYVLSIDREWYTVLDESKRTISYIPVGEVVDRTVCRVVSPPPNLPPPLVHLKPVAVSPVDPCPPVH